MDFGEWCDGSGKPSRYVDNMDNMFEAAQQLNTGFKLLLTPEYSVQPIDTNVEHMVNRYYDHPNAMRHNGTFCLSSYGMGGDAYNPTYGSITSPTNLGSGAYTAGGGAVWLTVAGTGTINGTVSARAAAPDAGPLPWPKDESVVASGENVFVSC